MKKFNFELGDHNDNSHKTIIWGKVQFWIVVASTKNFCDIAAGPVIRSEIRERIEFPLSVIFDPIVEILQNHEY